MGLAASSEDSSKRREEEQAAFEKLVDQSLSVSVRREAFCLLQKRLVPSVKHESSYARELQRVYALRYSTWTTHSNQISLESKTLLSSSIRGLLFGNAAADACGLATEFLSKTIITEYYGDSYSFCPGGDLYPDTHRINFAVGDWTDDTDQSVLLLVSMLETGGLLEPKNFAEKLLQWKSEGFVGLGDQGGVGLGSMTKIVLTRPGYADDPIETARSVWEQKGKSLAANGAIMRTAICGVPFFWDIDTVRSNTDLACQCTHADPRCRASCHLITSIVANLLQQHRSQSMSNPTELDVHKLIDDARQYAFPFLSTEEEREELRRYTTVRGKAFIDLRLDEEQSIGYTYKCLSCALLALSRASDLLEESLHPGDFEVDATSKVSHIFVKLIREIVREGGDADTNAAVAGALLGCYLGIEAVPHSWMTAMPYTTWLEAWTQKLIYMLQL